MRKTLVLWMIEVHKEYHLRPETLYLAVNILDRFCSMDLIERHNFQLLGTTALWVAAKYEENHGMDIVFLVNMILLYLTYLLSRI